MAKLESAKDRRVGPIFYPQSVSVGECRPTGREPTIVLYYELGEGRGRAYVVGDNLEDLATLAGVLVHQGQRTFGKLRFLMALDQALGEAELRNPYPPGPDE